MINICMAIHDADGNYCKYAAVAAQSLLNNSLEKMHFFILHDDTLAKQQMNRLALISEQNGSGIDFIKVEMPKDWYKLKSLKVFTIGTLFRLLIPDKLPRDIGKVIYIDADTLINIDIIELWDVEMEDSLVCGRKEVHYDNPLFSEGVSEDCYVNAGVLLMNLAEIRRQYDLYRESVLFFKAHPNCMWNDEDAINYVLNKKQKLISKRFNTFTVLEDESEPDKLIPCIYHFAGDHPRANGKRAFDREFFKTLRQTPWGENDEDIFDYFYNQIRFREEAFSSIRKIAMSIGSKKNIVFWGAKETIEYKRIKEIIDFANRNVWFVDSCEELQGTGFDFRRVGKPEDLIGRARDVYVVILAYNHYNEIASELARMGYGEGDDFADSRLLLSEEEGGRCLL